jgi:hypothetical protein
MQPAIIESWEVKGQCDKVNHLDLDDHLDP